MNKNKYIVHIDMNAYFASVEQSCNPKLRGRPIAVCGRGRTVVTTASYEARKLGVKTGMSRYEAVKTCPGLITIEGNHVKYIETSRRILNICLKYTPLIEVFSIDEVFMDITQLVNSKDSPLIIVNKIKQEIVNSFDITCSAGIAGSKLMAKLASEREKPDGLVWFKSEEEEEILCNTAVGDMCGIGKKTSKKLNDLGINTLKELGDADIQLLRKYFGFWGNILQRMGRGKDYSPLCPYNTNAHIKSVSHSNTLPTDTWDPEIVKAFLLMLSERVAYRLRKYNMTASSISIYVRWSDFTGYGRSKKINSEIRTGRVIYKNALLILEKHIPFKSSVRMLGVSVSALSEYKGQKDLFYSYNRWADLENTMDKINEVHGDFFLRPLSFEKAKNFTGKSLGSHSDVHGFLKLTG